MVNVVDVVDVVNVTREITRARGMPSVYKGRLDSVMIVRNHLSFSTRG